VKAVTYLKFICGKSLIAAEPKKQDALEGLLQQQSKVSQETNNVEIPENLKFVAGKQAHIQRELLRSLLSVIRPNGKMGKGAPSRFNKDVSDFEYIISIAELDVPEKDKKLSSSFASQSLMRAITKKIIPNIELYKIAQENVYGANNCALNISNVGKAFSIRAIPTVEAGKKVARFLAGFGVEDLSGFIPRHLDGYAVTFKNPEQVSYLKAVFGIFSIAEENTLASWIKFSPEWQDKNNEFYIEGLKEFVELSGIGRARAELRGTSTDNPQASGVVTEKQARAV
jgi:hypothetical protein